MITTDFTNSMQSTAMKQQASQPGDRNRFTELMRVSFDRQADATGENEELRNAANQLVAVAFIKPLMAQMRETPFKNEMFHGGQGETIFQEHLDTVIADRISSRSQFSIADAVYRKMSRSASAASGEVTLPQTSRVNQQG